MKLYSKTIGKLHFEDLSSEGFERLCRDLIDREYGWKSFHSSGLLGADEGIDIAGQIIENNSIKSVAVQCKRYKTFNLSYAIDSIDKILKNEKKYDIIILMISCEITVSTIRQLEEKYSDKKFELRIWTASNLESLLFSRAKDLLYLYFNIKLPESIKKKERSIKHALSIKNKLGKIFRVLQIDGFDENKVYRSNEVTLIPEDDNTYPFWTEGESQYQVVNFYQYYENGLEFTLTGASGIYILIDNTGQWEARRSSQLKTDKDSLPENIRQFHGEVIGGLNYKNIISYDPVRDYVFNSPRLYCDFNEKRQPSLEYIKYGVYKKNDFITKYTPDEYIIQLLDDNKKTTFNIP